jgi:hypothetical protein
MGGPNISESAGFAILARESKQRLARIAMRNQHFDSKKERDRKLASM